MSNCNKGWDNTSIEAGSYGCEEPEDGLAQASCITPKTCATVPTNKSCTSGYKVAQPYYQGVSICPEDDASHTVINTISQLYKNSDSFPMPACDADVDVVFPGITEAAIGAYLWSAGVGFLQITAFDAETSKLTLENTCPTGQCTPQLTAGAFIPSNSPFILATEPCDVNQAGGILGIFPYLASGFLTPSNGNCVEIATTNVNGLSANRIITLAGGTYRIDAILSGTSMRICNDGAGAPSGVAIDYQDTNGNYIHPITLIDTNPCANDDAFSGVPIVCDSGVQVPLIGTVDGQVLVYDHSTGVSNFRTLGIPTLNCTDLSVCLTLDPELPEGTAYLVTVGDTSGFSISDTVNILLSEFTITQIVNATEMRIEPLVHPNAIQTYPPGTTVCAADCCSINSNRLDELEESVGDSIDTLESSYTGNTVLTGSGQRNASISAIADADGLDTPIALAVAGERANGNVSIITMTNQSTVYTMTVLLTVTHVWHYRLDGVEGDAAQVMLEHYYGFGVAGGTLTLGAEIPKSHYHTPLIGGGNTARYGDSFTQVIAQTIPPGATRQAQARASLVLSIDDVSVGCYVDALSTRIGAIGVAVS